MSSDGAQTRFNPRAMLVALQRREVDFILIGGLARVARGADEITRDLDICRPCSRSAWGAFRRR